VAKDTAAATQSAVVTRLQLSQTRDACRQTLRSIQPSPAAPRPSRKPFTHLSARRSATVAAVLRHEEPAALRPVHQLQCQLHGPGVVPGHGHGLGQPLVLTRPPDRLASLHLQQPALLTRRPSVLLLKPPALLLKPQAHRHPKPQVLLTQRHQALLLLKPPALPRKPLALLTQRHQALLLLKPQVLLTQRHQALLLLLKPPALPRKPLALPRKRLALLTQRHQAHGHLRPQALTRRHSALHLRFLPPVSLTQHQPRVRR
jgi:hypothetical protein